jgi:hypothetical protein
LRHDNHAYRHHQKVIRDYIAKIRNKREVKIISSGGSKKFFSYINSKLKTKHSIPILLDGTSNPIAFTDKDKTEVFCDTFCNNYCSSLNTDTPPIFPKQQERPLNIDFSPVSVCNYLKNVPNKISVSEENIPQLVLKKCALPLALPLSIIFRDSYDSGIMPHQWKSQ